MEASYLVESLADGRLPTGGHVYALPGVVFAIFALGATVFFVHRAARARRYRLLIVGVVCLPLLFSVGVHLLSRRSPSSDRLARGTPLRQRDPKAPLELRRTATHNGIELWQIETGDLPVPEDERPQLGDFFVSFMHALSARNRLTETVWLEATQMHKEGTTRLLGPNAAAWMPRTGFGIHPQGPLPRMWTNDDFSGAPFGYQPPVFNNQVFEISRSSGHDGAIHTMAGRGVLMVLLLNGSVEAFKQQMNTSLGPLVKDESFRVYSYFFPLLTASEATDGQLQTWLGNASVYMRESAEDKAILIFSRIPLRDALRAMGSTEVSEGVWHLRTEETR